MSPKQQLLTSGNGSRSRSLVKFRHGLGFVLSKFFIRHLRMGYGMSKGPLLLFFLPYTGVEGDEGVVFLWSRETITV